MEVRATLEEGLVRVPDVITLPEILRSKKIDRTNEGKDPFYDWVKLHDLLAYLKTLQKH